MDEVEDNQLTYAELKKGLQQVTLSVCRIWLVPWCDLHSLQAGMPVDSINRFFLIADTDGDKMITFEEFWGLIQHSHSVVRARIQCAA